MSTQQSMILLAIAACADWSTRPIVSQEAAVIAAWKLFPEAFGLGPWGAKHPSSNAVLSKLCRLVDQRLVERPVASGVSLTRRGVGVARAEAIGHARELARLTPGILAELRATSLGERTEEPEEQVPPTRRSAPGADPPPAPRRRRPAPRRVEAVPELPAPLAGPVPLTPSETDRMRRIVTSYNVRGFARGVPVDANAARAAWGLAHRATPDNVAAMEEFGRFLVRVIVSETLGSSDAGFLRSVHRLVIDRSAAWLAERGVDAARLWR